MPAFGKNGIVNLEGKGQKTMWQLVKPDGTVVMSCECKGQLESHKDNLSQKMNCELQIVEKSLSLL